MALRTPIGTGDADDDRVRFEEIWSDREILRNYCRRIVGDGPLVDDMVQEAYAEAFLQLDGLERRSSFLPWLATVAKRRGLNELRRYQYATPVEDVPEALSRAEHDPAEVVARRDQVRRLQEALLALTPRERALLLRQVNDGSSISELAAEEASTPGSVRSVLLRARAKLRSQIEDGAAWALLPVIKLGDWSRRRLGSVSSRAGEATPFAQVAYQRLGEVVVAAVVMTTSLVGDGGAGAAPTLVLGRTDTQEAASILPGWMFEHPRSLSEASSVPTRRGSHGGDDEPPWESGFSGSPSGTSSPSGDDSSSWPLGAPVPDPEDPPVTPPEPPDPPPTPIEKDPVETPEDTHILDLEATAPRNDGGDQHVFALGRNTGSCPSNCIVLFHSPDGGATWVKLPAVGMGSPDAVLVAPNYPTDRRIFVMSAEGLGISNDGGLTFQPAEDGQHSGTVAMSPEFANGDERILIGGVPSWTYDAHAHQSSPYTAVPFTGSETNFAFAPDFASSKLLFAGSFLNGPSVTTRALVYRCVNDQCDSGTELKRVYDPPQVAVSSRFATDGVVFAWVADDVYRSADRGLTFERVHIVDSGGVKALTDDGRGNFYAAASDQTAGTGGVFVSADAGATWVLRGSSTVLGRGVGSVLALADGSILAAPEAGAGTGLLCSADHGSTWATRCA